MSSASNLGVDLLLVQPSAGVPAAHAPAGAVVDRIAGLLRSWIGDHDHRPGAGIARQQDRMARLVERRVLKRMVAGGKGPRGALAMHPGHLVVHYLLPGDVVADEINQFALDPRKNLLKCFQN